MADKWIQLMSEDGVDNLYPTSHMDLLWENASPTATFSAQTVSLDLSGYHYVYVIVRATTGEAHFGSHIVPVGTSQELLCVATTYLRKRNATISTNGVTFDGGYNQSSINSWEASTASAIPYRIYGIK